MFHVGQKVVFVGGKFSYSSPSPQEFRVHKGEIYTVREIDFRGVDAGLHEYATLRLDERKRPLIKHPELGPWEVGYVLDAFRPLTERKTDTGMAILKKLLQPKHERV